MTRVSIALVLAFSVLPAAAWAQPARWEVGVGGVYSGSASAGTVDATLIDPTGGPLTLYRTTNRIASGLGVEGLVSRKLGERLRVELAIGWGSTDFESQISSDFENVPGLTVAQKVTQYTGDLALAYRVVQQDRFDLFVRAAGGAFREITSDSALVDNGWRASVGGGALIRLTQSSGWFGHLGLRADLRLQARGGGIAFGDSRTRLSPSAFAGLVIGQ